MRDLAYPIQMSIGDDIRRRSKRAIARDVLLFIWIAFWVCIGIGLLFAAGSIQ